MVLVVGVVRSAVRVRSRPEGPCGRPFVTVTPWVPDAPPPLWWRWTRVARAGDGLSRFVPPSLGRMKVSWRPVWLAYAVLIVVATLVIAVRG